MPATITVQGASPAGASGSGFWAPYTEDVAAAGVYTVPQGEFYVASTEPCSLQVQTETGVWTTTKAIAASDGSYVYSDGTNVQILMGATAGVLTLAQFRGR